MDPNNGKLLEDVVQKSQNQPQENVEINISETKIDNPELHLRGQNINIDINSL